jgi:3',5'-cyclic AMP phosphodiesterase CpdA
MRQPRAPQAPQTPSADGAIQTFRDRKLSLWQSAVEEVVARRQAGARGAVRGVRPELPITSEAVRSSAPVLAATALAAALDAGHPLADPQPALPAGTPVATRGAVDTAWMCNKLALQLAWAKATGDTHAAETLANELKFGSCDPLWAECAEQYVTYYVKDKGNIPYRSGGDYVLDLALPPGATIALFGDGGTGSALAANLVGQIARKNPDLVIHLGDIYYAGTQAEVQARFLDVCRQALGDTSVLSLAGNHDMYSGGAGYYWLVDQLGQRASYFCVRNDHWQLLAMDTGYNDYNPFTIAGNVTSLTEVEAAWHRAKIAEGSAAGRRTILLSHHQLFSAYEAIGRGFVNQPLLTQFQDLLGSVEAWFWGHEHSLSLYAPYLGLKRGRCVGCSAIPVFVQDDYYQPKYDVPLLPDPDHGAQTIRLGDNGTIYNHAYAILTLDGPGARVAYYDDSNEQQPLYVESIR